jgi:hypothetical protein
MKRLLLVDDELELPRPTTVSVADRPNPGAGRSATRPGD